MVHRLLFMPNQLPYKFDDFPFSIKNNIAFSVLQIDLWPTISDLNFWPTQRTCVLFAIHHTKRFDELTFRIDPSKRSFVILTKVW
jgi:hypothetical protein